MKLDFLIIGQGLAGSFLAWELIDRGCTVVIIDNGANNASKVAAGLINPVTGLRFVKSQGVDTFLPLAQSFYVQLSNYFQHRFYIEKPMLRIFRTDQEIIQSLKRVSDPQYHLYLGNIHAAMKSVGLIKTPLGYLEQVQTGYLKTKNVLCELKKFFISKACFRQARLDYREIQIEPTLAWRDLCPKQVIFCEGYEVMDNPWFSWLPMQPVKGEILTLERPSGFPEYIINYRHWLLPVDHEELRIGATFDRNNINNETTGIGKCELTNSFKHVIPDLRHSKLLDHQSGIRPCTPDRQPLIGKHPQFRQLYIFNGFGAKGSLLIPGYCRMFANHLLTEMPLPEACDIQRYYATHFIA